MEELEEEEEEEEEEMLQEILCPSGTAGRISAMSDEFGVVYLVDGDGERGELEDGNCGGERSLVFVSFGRGWWFEGMRGLRIDRRRETEDFTRRGGGGGSGGDRGSGAGGENMLVRTKRGAAQLGGVGSSTTTTTTGATDEEVELRGPEKKKQKMAGVDSPDVETGSGLVECSASSATGRSQAHDERTARPPLPPPSPRGITWERAMCLDINRGIWLRG